VRSSWSAVLALVLFSACKPSLEQCVAARASVPPAACHKDWTACGVLSTSAGEVDCGGCPGELVCGQVEPNVCGGIVCATPRGDRQVIRELGLVWSADAGVFVSPSYFGLHFVAGAEDSKPSAVPDTFNNRGNVYGPVTLTGNVVEIDVKYSLNGSGQPGLIVSCAGAAPSTVSVPGR